MEKFFGIEVRVKNGRNSETGSLKDIAGEPDVVDPEEDYCGWGRPGSYNVVN